jgi:hypothetical protein
LKGFVKGGKGKQKSKESKEGKNNFFPSLLSLLFCFLFNYGAEPSARSLA